MVEKPSTHDTKMAQQTHSANSKSALQQAHLPLNAERSDPNLIKMQQETQAKYLAALNELQLLKVSRDIAQTNQAIMAARLATVVAEKKMTDIISPPEPTAQEYAQNLVNPVEAKSPAPTPAATTKEVEAPTYTVVSVSQLLNQWSAVLGAQGNLYSVKVGDVLPLDQSKIISIDKSGVTLVKDGERLRISMVPVI